MVGRLARALLALFWPKVAELKHRGVIGPDDSWKETVGIRLDKVPKRPTPNAIRNRWPPLRFDL